MVKFYEQKSERDIALHCVNLIPIKEGKPELSFSLMVDYIDKFIYNYIEEKYPFNLDDKIKCHNIIVDEFNSELYFKFKIKAIPVRYNVKNPNEVYNTFVYIDSKLEDKYNEEKQKLNKEFEILLSPEFNNITALENNLVLFRKKLIELNEKYSLLK